MKKFTLLIVSCLVCFALASCQKTEPEPECKLKDFPYEIFEVKKMKLYIASEKYHHPDLDCSAEELYASYNPPFQNYNDFSGYFKVFP